MQQAWELTLQKDGYVGCGLLHVDHGAPKALVGAMPSQFSICRVPVAEGEGRVRMQQRVPQSLPSPA